MSVTYLKITLMPIMKRNSNHSNILGISYLLEVKNGLNSKVLEDLFCHPLLLIMLLHETEKIFRTDIEIKKPSLDISLYRTLLV